MSPSTPFHPKQEPKGNGMCDDIMNAIDRFDKAAQSWGWQADMGTGDESMQESMDEHLAAHCALSEVIARAIQAEGNAECERIASHLFNRNGFMTATSSDGDYFVKIAFLNAQEMQDFHRALVELSVSRSVPAPPAAITEGSE